MFLLLFDLVLKPSSPRRHSKSLETVIKFKHLAVFASNTSLHLRTPRKSIPRDPLSLKKRAQRRLRRLLNDSKELPGAPLELSNWYLGVPQAPQDVAERSQEHPWSSQVPFWDALGTISDYCWESCLSSLLHSQTLCSVREREQRDLRTTTKEQL